MKVNERFKNKLLVEGNDDHHVILALCEKFQINENFDIIDCEGIEKLYEQIPVRAKQLGIETLGIILDADTDIVNRWASMVNLLTILGFPMPQTIPKEGLILSRKDKVKIGIWIMPNNDLGGMLEDFLTFMVPEEDRLLPVINSTMTHLENKGINKYSLIHKSKATIHSWLALQESPGTPMGLSITKRYLTTDNETCTKLIDWLRMLYT